MSVQEMIRTHPHQPAIDGELLARCIEECFQCAATCASCADACLGEESVRDLVRCIRFDLDCADVCLATGRVLTRQTDQRPLQLGIVRLKRHLLDAKVCEDIESERIPLGRVLINRQAMRDVQLWEPYRVTCGPELAQTFVASIGQTAYGRTAMIRCHGEPAVEVLEIISPLHARDVMF